MALDVFVNTQKLGLLEFLAHCHILVVVDCQLELLHFIHRYCHGSLELLSHLVSAAYLGC